MAKKNTDKLNLDSREEIAEASPQSGTLRSARIVEPLIYWSSNGKQLKIPVGPCLIEQMAGAQVEIIWGASGQNSTGIAQKDIELAERSGSLLMLD